MSSHMILRILSGNGRFNFMGNNMFVYHHSNEQMTYSYAGLSYIDAFNALYTERSTSKYFPVLSENLIFHEILELVVLIQLLMIVVCCVITRILESDIVNFKISSHYCCVFNKLAISKM